MHTVPMTSTSTVASTSETTAHLQHFYAVYVIWDGETGCDMFPLGYYANELHARRVAKEHTLFEGQRIQVSLEPILDAPEEQDAYIDSRGGDSAGGHVYSRDAG